MRTTTKSSTTTRASPEITRLASHPKASEAAARRRVAFERVVVPLAIVGTLDLVAKRAVVVSFAVDERRVVVPHVLDLTLVENAHGAMGLFGDRPAVLVALALLALAALWMLLRTTLERSAAAQIGFGLVAGGALGNVTDRLVHGYVVDFIALPHFYVFNLADAAISIGLALVAVPMLARQRAPLER